MPTIARKSFHLAKEYLTRQTLDDDFVPWLLFANPGMQNPGNVLAMDTAIANLPSANPVIEIGSFCGLSTNLLSYLIHKHHKTNPVIATDPWTFEGAGTTGTIGASNVTWPSYAQFIRESYQRHVAFFSQGLAAPAAIQLSSDAFFAAWNRNQTLITIDGREQQLGGPISFAYIDGEHTYDQCHRDFDNTDRHLEPGGYILFDDSKDANPFGLTPLMKEIKTSGRYELICKNPNYLFRKTN